MEYEEFLFSQLFMNYLENNDTEYKELEYDLIFPVMLKHREAYLSSPYFLANKGEYMCILDYLNNEIKLNK